MGWDVILLNVPSKAKSIADLPEDGVVPLGERHVVLDSIRMAFPDADMRDDTWVTVFRKNFSLAINIEKGEQVESIAVHVHGSAEAVNEVAHLCEVTGWSALDASIGDLIDFSSDNRFEGYQRWQEYSKHISEK